MDAPGPAVAKAEAPWAAELPEPGAELVTVARFVDLVEASLARNCLEEAGVAAFLADAETVSVAWQLTNALGGIKLQVAEPDADRARAVLQEQRDGATGDRDELAREAIAAAPAPGGAGDEPPPADDGSDEPEPEPTTREEDAERAFRGAVYGLLFFPLQFYASFLLLRVLFSSKALAGRSRGRAVVAAVINVAYMLILLVFGSAAFISFRSAAMGIP
jgi:hypothetical protein